MAGLILKKLFLILMCLTVPVGALAADADDKDALFGVSHDAQKLQLSVRRIGLDWSKTQVQNAEEYQDSPVSALNATSQDYIKGVFDTILEYTKNKIGRASCRERV